MTWRGETSDAREIRGYAISWGEEAKPEKTGGIYETVRKGAFADVGAWPVQAQFGAHGVRAFAWSGDGSVELWEDRYGLAFRCLAAAASSISMMRAVRNERPGVSVNFVTGHTQWKDAGSRNGHPVKEVIKARIDHFSLMHGVAYGETTGCWAAIDDPRDLPRDIGALAARWDAGRAAHLDARRRTVANAARPPARTYPVAPAARAPQPAPRTPLAAGFIGLRPGMIIGHGTWRPSMHELALFAQQMSRP